MPKVSRMNLSSLQNAAHFQHMKYITDLAAKSTAVSKRPLSRNAFKALQDAFNEEDRCLMLAKGSTLTEKISKADSERDQLYSAYKQTVKVMRAVPMANMSDAAKKLWRHISDYKISTTMALDKQTALLTNFIDDLEKSFTAEVAALNLQTVVSNLKTANQQVENLVRDRALATSGESTGALRTARLATDAAYLRFIEVMDALYIVYSEAVVSSFIDDLNTIIARTKGSNTTKPKTDNSTPTEPEEEEEEKADGE